jgi:hypothetical protein
VQAQEIGMSAQLQVQEPVVVCPECGHPFPLTRALTGPIEAQVAQRLEAEYRRRDGEREVELRQRVEKAAAQASAKANADREAELADLRHQVAEQQEKLQRHQQEELALRKRTRELQAREQELAVEVERRVDNRAKQIEEETTRKLQEQQRLKDLEKDKVIGDLRRQLEDAIRKAQQGSQQIQGEVAELDLENQLRQAFPRDEFEVVCTGQKGADIVQRVMDPHGLVGTITYEVKNTKNFMESWIPKLREDQRAKGAELAVLVSGVLPKEITTFANRGGVWVTSFPACLPLAMALRWGLFEAARLRLVAENHAEKQAELLAYCGGTEFRQRIEGMLEAVKGMMDDTEREHQAMVSMLARRRKRQEQVARAIAGLYGDVSAIIGTLPRIQRLELPPGDTGGGQAA